jgi:hypothetical protein
MKPRVFIPEPISSAGFDLLNIKVECVALGKENPSILFTRTVHKRSATISTPQRTVLPDFGTSSILSASLTRMPSNSCWIA